MQLQERLNKILVDIVSVTNEIRIEQLREEYNEVESKLLELSELEHYKRLYRTCSLSQALENTNNIDISKICKIFMLRPLTTLDNTRLLIPFLSACNASLEIRDMQSVLIDTIGKGETKYTVYVYCLSKYNLGITPCVAI